MRLLLRVPLVWCLSTLALAFASVAEAQTKILCGLTTAPGPGIAYLYFGKELGFDRQEGIDLEFVVLPGTPAVYQQLAAGRIQIGLPQPDPLVKALAKGERLPIRFIFNVIRRSESEMVVLDASQYRNIKDLKGQSIGVGGMGWGNVPKTRALLRQAGLVDGKDFTLTAVGDGAPAFKALMDGQVAALNLNDSRHAALEASGVKIRRLPMPTEYEGLLSNGVATSESFLRSQPEVLAKTMRVFAKSLVACEANPEACVKAFWKANPERRDQSVPEAQAMAAAMFILKERQKRLLAQEWAAKKRLGEYPAADIANFISVLHQGEEIETDKIDTAAVFTNQFVDRANDFDLQRVVQDARAATVR